MEQVTRQSILDAVRKLGEASQVQISTRLGLSGEQWRVQGRHVLERMAAAGIVLRMARGLYTLPPETKPTAPAILRLWRAICADPGEFTRAEVAFSTGLHPDNVKKGLRWLRSIGYIKIKEHKIVSGHRVDSYQVVPAKKGLKLPPFSWGQVSWAAVYNRLRLDALAIDIHVANVAPSVRAEVFLPAALTKIEAAAESLRARCAAIREKLEEENA